MTCPNCGKEIPADITPTMYGDEALCSLPCYRARVTDVEPKVAAMINGMFG
jgi:hypothetical protein